MKEKHPIDDYFKKALEDHTTPPSSSVWDKISAESSQSAKTGTGWYLLRAAVVVLMVGVGSWLYFEQQKSPVVASQPVEEHRAEDEASKEQSTKKEASENTKDQEEIKQELERKKDKVMPIMRNRPSVQPVYVVNEPEMEVVDEEELYAEAPEQVASVSLDPQQIKAYSRPEVKLKFRLSSPVTESTFYATTDSLSREKDQDIRDRLYAYANDQWENILSGKSVELPKTRKPHLEINLNRIFNN